MKSLKIILLLYAFMVSASARPNEKNSSNPDGSAIANGPQNEQIVEEDNSGSDSVGDGTEEESNFRRTPLINSDDRIRSGNSRGTPKDVPTSRDSKPVEPEDIGQRTGDVRLRKLPKDFDRNEDRKIGKLIDSLFRREPRDGLRNPIRMSENKRQDTNLRGRETIRNLFENEERQEQLKRPEQPVRSMSGRPSAEGRNRFVGALENATQGRGQNPRTRNFQEEFFRNMESNRSPRSGRLEEKRNGLQTKNQDRTIYSNGRTNLVRTGFRTNVENLRGPQNFERARDSSTFERNVPNGFGEAKMFSNERRTLNSYSELPRGTGNLRNEERNGLEKVG